MDQLLVESIGEVDAGVQGLSGRFERPRLVKHDEALVMRHENYDDALASYLKCVRVASNLNACVVLGERGFVLEVLALCRGIDEAIDDVFFLGLLADGEKMRKDQERLCKEFFQEEFAKAGDGTSSLPRDRVPRDNIHAALARSKVKGLNPHDAGLVLKSLHKVFSGYVHGAYVHIMDLYGGSPGRYHTGGMRDVAERMVGCEALLAHYAYRAMCGVRVVAKRTGCVEVDQSLQGAADRLASAFDLGAGEIGAVLKRIKARQKD